MIASLFFQNLMKINKSAEDLVLLVLILQLFES
jgi:hypothetical protein